jgi:hypothetical protein
MAKFAFAVPLVSGKELDFAGSHEMMRQKLLPKKKQVFISDEHVY